MKLYQCKSLHMDHNRHLPRDQSAMMNEGFTAFYEP